jgi:hypothetical protein
MIKLKYILENITPDFEELIDNGLNTEYPEIAANIERYTYDLDLAGLDEALSNINYGAYKADLDRILLKLYPSGKIPVKRIENYLGNHFSVRKPKSLKYTSVSIDPHWGLSMSQQGKKVTEKVIDLSDVVAAGHTAEGELIVKNWSG